ncbi:MAG: lysophospholipid acyltransferase family protein [Balneolaceae bacterium]
MRNLIAIGKIILFILATFYHYSILLFGNVLSIFGGNKIKWKAKRRKIWGNAVARIIGMRVLVNGNPPKTPFFLVSNHLSYVDVWVLYSQLNCTFIAKSEVKSWPIIGFVLATSGVLFVDRSKRKDVKRVNDEISNNLTEDQGIVLFPEGTTSAGHNILPFKSSLFQYPATEELPVSVASLHYETPDTEIPAFKSVCWWDDTSFFKHLFYLFVMNEFTATVTFSEETVINSNRKVLASSTQKILERTFKPVIDPETYAKASIGS